MAAAAEMLVGLNLVSNGLTDDSGQAILAVLPHLPNLLMLLIEGNSLSPPMQEAIRGAAPGDCQVKT